MQRPKTSKKNPYYISKDRYYELLHFCRQYHEWKHAYETLDVRLASSIVTIRDKTNDIYDPVGNMSVSKSQLHMKMLMIENAAKQTDNVLWPYILKSVIDEVPYDCMDVPCCKDYFYAARRRFFYYLSIMRD